MSSERDLFANFERMRRDMDELFGDVFERALSPHRRGGFSPAVDVYYTGGVKPKAVVRADLAGISPDEIELEVRGRELIISGDRHPNEADDRLYQQLEIAHGPFRRVVSLGANVETEDARAFYEDGILIIELPLAAASVVHTVPIKTVEGERG
jgi:HSP20 family protein